LKQNSSNTPYASRSAIYLSKLYSQESKNEEAIKELIWASENATEESIQSLAYYHLANLYFIANKLDQAMDAAKKINTIGFQTLAQDIIGDIHLKQGNKEQASKSYLDSLKSHKGPGNMRKILQNKIDSIGK
ncbi:MAG: putative negative regulator of RcsB-dependent stress response, partial [Methylophilaceae bacterium]